MSPEHQAIVKRIRESAAKLQRAAAALAPAQHNTAPREGEWSAQQVVLHTRDVAMLAYGLRIRRLLIEDNPEFATYNDEDYRQLYSGHDEKIDNMVTMIAAEHDLVARVLETLPDAHWKRAGRHPQYGERDIEFFAERLAAHAEEHAEQLTQMSQA